MEQDIVNLLKERIMSLEEAYEQKISELSLLKELGDTLKITSLANWDELFTKQLDIVKQHTGIYSGSLMLIDEETEELYIVSVSGLYHAEKRPAIKLKRGEGVAGKVFEAVQTLYIPDVTKDPNFLDKGTRQQGSLACVPIISEGACIGVLNFRDNTPRSFSPNDLRFFELIADQLSITASLVRAYTELISLEKKRMNLSRYFSRGLAEHLVADDRMTQLGGEMKTVTVLFADIVGFTPLVEKSRVEDVVQVLNRYFEAVVPCLFKRGGMLDKFLGDGVMAVFGIPDASEEDPMHAIECAVDIQRQVIGQQAALVAEGLFPIEVCIGIASGNVLAGNIGTQEQMNYTVIGEPVNLAQRLESIAAPREIIISKITYELARRLTSAGFAFEPLPQVRIKGISRDVVPIRVLYEP
jgi:adenylate cyclase